MSIFNMIKSSPGLLGVEIDFSSIRFTEVYYTKGNPILTRSLEERLPLKETGQPISWLDDEFPHFLKEMLTRAHITTRRVAIALPDEMVFFNILPLDRRCSYSEKRNRIHYDALQCIEVPLSDLVIDFDVVGEKQAHSDLQEIRWVAARKRDLCGPIKAISMAGLTPVIIDIDSLALHRVTLTYLAHKKEYFRNTVGSIHLYQHRVVSVVFKGEHLLYHLGESFELSSEEDLYPTLERCVRKMQKAFSFDCLFLSGNISLQAVSSKEIYPKLNIDIPVQVLNGQELFQGVKDTFLNFSVLFGLVLRGREGIGY